MKDYFYDDPEKFFPPIHPNCSIFPLRETDFYYVTKRLVKEYLEYEQEHINN